MAAAFQNAARTLGGRALQRTQAAAAPEAGLWPRLTPSGSPATASSSRLFGSSSSCVPNRYRNMDVRINPIFKYLLCISIFCSILIHYYPQDDTARVLMELDQKKEEMYNLLTKVTGNRKYRHPFGLNHRQNLRLQTQLSVQVDVRPDCGKW